MKDTPLEEERIATAIGSRINARAFTGTARLWDVDDHMAIDCLCSSVLRDFTEEEQEQLVCSRFGQALIDSRTILTFI